MPVCIPALAPRGVVCLNVRQRIIFPMSPRLYRIICAFGVAGLISFACAIIFLGYSSRTGAPHLSYRKTQPSSEQYKSDCSAVINYLAGVGFHSVPSCDIPETVLRRLVPANEYKLIESMQYDIPLSRPISLRLYAKDDRSDILVVYCARNPTWAVPFQKLAFSKFRIMSLLSFWSQYLKNENA